MKTTDSHLSTTFVSVSRTLVLLGVACLGWAGANAQTPLPIYEPFPASYTNGAPDETVSVPAGGASYPARRVRNAPTTALWSIGGAAGGGSPVAVGGVAALSYPGLYQAPGSIGMFIRTNNTTATRSPGILFTTTSSGTLYASMLLNVQSPPSATDPVGPNRLFAKLDSATTGTGSGAMAGVWLTSNNTLALSKSSNTAPSADTGVALAAGTHLIVMRYLWNNVDLTDDEVALWVDPPAASFSVPEASVPAPTIITTTGSDVASLSSFYIYHIGTEVVASMFLDEIRVATNWADVTSTQALCTAASIATPLTNQVVSEGIGASLSVMAGGSSPAFQWQVSTNSGATWYSVSGGTSQSYVTQPLTPDDNGNQYRVVANVACNNSSATSTVATVTVVPAVITPRGVVVDDVFQDFYYNNLPYGVSNSVWLAGAVGSLDATSGLAMNGTVPAGGSVTWIGYFTDDSVTNLPVHLDVGRGLKGTLVFRASNITSNNGSVRIGYYDYGDGGPRLTADGFGNNTAARNVRGYMATVNFGTNFSGNPFSLYARNNLTATDLMGTTGNFLSLGGGPGGYAGAPAFQNDVDYTLDFLVARKAVGSVEVTATISGGGTNWTHTRVDNTCAYPRFDTVALRMGSAETSGNPFTFARFLVQVVNVPPNAIPLDITASSGGIKLTWSNPVFTLQSASEASGTYTNVPGANSPYPVTVTDVRKFFRLVYTNAP